MQWREGTKKNLIARFVQQGLNRREVYDALKPMVQSQTEPMVFKRNTSAGRIAKPISDQLQDLWADIGRVIVLLNGNGSGEEPEIPASVPETTPEENPEIPAPEMVKPEKRTKISTLRQELEFFVREVQRIRQWCKDRAVQGTTVDTIGMRPVKEGRKMILSGKIPARAALFVMAMHWPEATRREAGIENFDLSTLGEKVSPKSHRMLGYAIILAELKIPLMLIGPAGTGKSFLLRQLAEYFEVEYGECPMTAGATPSWLLGSWVPDPEEPYKSRAFVDRYASGGVFNFEEIDRSDPNMLMVVNNAISADSMFNPVTGIEIPKHDDVIISSTANTFGLGGGRDYTGAERLDFATIDRFRMGRILVDMDEDLEWEIALDGVE